MTKKLYSALLLSTAMALALPFAAMLQTGLAAATVAVTTKTVDVVGAAA